MLVQCCHYGAVLCSINLYKVMHMRLPLLGSPTAVPDKFGYTGLPFEAMSTYSSRSLGSRAWER